MPNTIVVTTVWTHFRWLFNTAEFPCSFSVLCISWPWSFNSLVPFLIVPPQSPPIDSSWFMLLLSVLFWSCLLCFLIILLSVGNSKRCLRGELFLILSWPTYLVFFPHSYYILLSDALLHMIVLFYCIPVQLFFFSWSVAYFLRVESAVYHLCILWA